MHIILTNNIFRIYSPELLVVIAPGSKGREKIQLRWFFWCVCVSYFLLQGPFKCRAFANNSWGVK